jgi:hypothetical protein
MFFGRPARRALLWLLAGLVLLPLGASAQTATVAWDPNPESDIGGYVVGYGTQSRVYSQTVDAGRRTSWTLSGLTAGRRYYFAVRAYNTAGLVGPWSAEVSTVIASAPPVDTDSDGLPDTWETAAGLDPATSAGANGAAGDPDGDGRTNLQEYQAGTHPRGFVTRYFAEGANSNFFTTQFAFFNPGDLEARVLLRFLRIDGVTVQQWLSVLPRSRSTLLATVVPGLTSASFSTTIESDQSVVADRTMTWDAAGYGAHTETAVTSPATTWYLAEGATHSGFDLFYLVQNPGDAVASVEVRYLFPSGSPLVKRYDVAPQSRFNIWVDYEDARLAQTDVSAVITSLTGQPIIVERAMYANSGGRFFGAGQSGAGVTSPATRWYLAEGATGPYFDLYVLVGNPGSSAAQVRATFLLPGGSTVVKNYTVAAASRFNIWVDAEDARLAATPVSTIVESTNGVPIIAERAMWWPGNYTQWRESHGAAGATRTGTVWALADGENGGSQQRATYVLVANTSTFAGNARVTLTFEDGTRVERTYALPARGRVSIDVAADFPGSQGRRFATLVESLGSNPAQIIVERAMYWDANGERWSAGTAAMGTILR